MIGPDRTGASAMLGALPILSATLAPLSSWDGARVFAFCGIARPEKFFATVREAGGEVLGCAIFGDHHRFTRRELDGGPAKAARLGARPVTTAKDAARLPPSVRRHVEVLAIRLVWRDDEVIERMLDGVLR